MKSKPAFTLVELLVVVVVIGILSSVSVLAYSGVQNRAYKSKSEADISQYKKLLKYSLIESQEYPTASWIQSRVPNSSLARNMIVATGMAEECFSATMSKQKYCYLLSDGCALEGCTWAFLVYWNYGDNTWHRIDAIYDQGDISLQEPADDTSQPSWGTGDQPVGGLRG